MLKIYGERNTGTNYLARLVALNLEVEQLSGVVPHYVMWLRKQLPGNDLVRDLYYLASFRKNLGWKHCLVDAERLRQCRVEKRGVRFVTLTKNPYSWLLSLHRRPYNKRGMKRVDFLEFLQRPWLTVGRENAPASYPTPMDLWNDKSAANLRLKDRLPAVSLRYEDLLDDPRQVVSTIAETFGIAWKGPEFRNLDESTKESTKDFSWYRDYYLNERWRADLPPGAAALITPRLNEKTVRAHGYEVLE